MRQNALEETKTKGVSHNIPEGYDGVSNPANVLEGGGAGLTVDQFEDRLKQTADLSTKEGAWPVEDPERDV